MPPFCPQSLRPTTGLLAGLCLGLIGFGCGSHSPDESAPGAPSEAHFLDRAQAFTPLPPAPPDATMHGTGPSAPLEPNIRRFESDAAAEMGHRLFFDKRLSGDGQLSCATCHDPEHGFADPRPLADGMGKAKRHAPTLLNVAHHRWFGWGGKSDTLWSQATGPLESSQEMGGTRGGLARLVYSDPALQEAFRKVTHRTPFPPTPGPQHVAFPDALPPGVAAGERAQEYEQNWSQLSEEAQAEIQAVFVVAAKSLAAYQRELVTGPSPFDRYVAALAAGESTEAIPFGASERRGFELFAGKARCFVCHSGPFFSDGEFHNTGAPPLHGGEPEDSGRFGDAKLLQADPFNATGAFSADPHGQTAERTRLLKTGSEQWGEFKTPSLRNVALSPPYMHQGQFETLEAVVDFYDTLENSVGASHHQEQILQPIGLTEVEKQDLLAFLRSLTGTPVPEKWTQDPFQ